MLNRVILIGRLTADPEIKKVGEHSVCNFTLAVDRGFKNAAGEKETDFIKIVVWRKQAELCKQYCFKGQLVAIEGALRVRTYQDKDDNRRWISEVEADNVRFLEWGKGSPKVAATNTNADPAPAQEPPPAKGSGFDEDDDLPF